MKFKIGINALPLIYPITGIGRYTFEIIKQLSSYPEVELYLYTCCPLKVDVSALKNVRLCLDPSSMNKKLWQQLKLGALIQRDQLHLFWSPRHHLPFFTGTIPCVVTIHDLVYRKFPGTMRLLNLLSEKLLLHYSVKKAKQVITVSQATQKDLMAELAVPKKKISVIHSGYFEPPAHTLINLNSLGITKPFVLFLGTLEPRKNIARLIDAFLALPLSLKKQYQLVLAGGIGWKSQEIQTRLNDPSTQGTLLYVGYVNDHEAYSLFKQAALFAFPSLYEGFGLPLLEAMNAETPILTSTDPACQEIAGDAAVCVNPYDIPGMSSALQEMLEHPELRARLTQKGRSRLQKFSWQASAQAHFEVFKKVLSHEKT